MQIDLIDSIALQNTLGEAVIWDERTGHIWWTDIPQRLLYRYAWEGKTCENFVVPERIGSLGLTSDPDILIIAFESGFGLFSPLTGKIVWLHRPEKDDTGRRFNDGRVDRQGHFWAGTMVEDDKKAAPASGSLYRIGPSAITAVMTNNIIISNGICWSMDSSILYFADSPRQTIFAYDYAPQSDKITNKRIFAATPDGIYPDGADVDSQGHIWSAQWGGGRIVRYAPDGSIDHILTLPARQPTCIAFGGPDMTMLFVTTARDGLTAQQLAKEPQAGNLLIYQTDITGLPAQKYPLENIIQAKK